VRYREIEPIEFKIIKGNGRKQEVSPEESSFFPEELPEIDFLIQRRIK
jgi:hypothetical protein